MLENFQFYPDAAPEEQTLPEATFEPEIEKEAYGRYKVYPLRTGWGLTLGNALRRTLLNSLKGTAVTWVRIDNISHEFTTVPHMREEVMELLLNIKGIRLRSLVERPGKLRLEVSGKGEVRAGDIMATNEFEIVNPDHHLAYLDDASAVLSVELNVESGMGFQEATHDKSLPAGVLSLDAIYTPIKRANYVVEPRRWQQLTDVECLIMEVWTDKTINPGDAVKEAAKLLRDKCHIFVETPVETETSSSTRLAPDVYNRTIESLNLSARTQNSLRRVGIERIGQVLEKSQGYLLEIRNFGQKSLTELFDKLEEEGIVGKDSSEAGVSVD